MKKIICTILFFSYLITNAQNLTTDVLVIGGGTGATAAAIQSARLKVKTILVEPTTWLGGMLTAAGVSATDGNNNLPSGLWEEFRQALYKHYNTKNLNTGWVSNTLFEPHVGDSIFKAFCKKEEKHLKIYYKWQLKKIIKHNNKITAAIFFNEDGKQLAINCKICIDATELGDVMALSNTAYDVGMEDSSYSKEPMAPGKNNIIQDLTWAAILKDYGKNADKTIARPDGYDSTKFFKSCLSKFNNDTVNTAWTAQKMLNYGKIKNNKYMLNWPASGNDYYLNVIEDNIDTRNKKYAAAKKHTLQFIYYIQKDLGFKNLGLADDEFNTEDKLALIPYNRESRRLKGLVRLTNNNLVNPYNDSERLYRTGIAVGDYPVDHHHHKNEAAPKIKFSQISSYNIPLGALIPQTTDGLIVAEKNISVSNIANGTTRLQPVVMLTGQAAGALAAYCIMEKVQPRNAKIREVQQLLLNAKCFLMPYVDVKPDDVYWEAIQKIGATGILKGTSKSEGWANKTYFYPDSTIAYDEFVSGINNFIPCLPIYDTILTRPLQIKEAWDMLIELLHVVRLKKNISHPWPSISENEQITLWQQIFLEKYPGDTIPITRKQIAVLFNNLNTNPFSVSINFKGKIQ